MTKAKGNIWKGIIMLVLGTVFMLPVFLIVMNSFKTGKEILTNFVSFPTSLYLDNFVQAMKTMRYASSFLNSAVLTVLTVFISLIVSYLAAYGISHLKGKLSSGFYIFFILGQVIPFHAVMIAITIMAKTAHLNNSLFGLALMYGGLNCGFGIMTYMGFLKSVPAELEEAAMIDGCSPLRTFFCVVVPMMKPTFISVGILEAMWIWNDFLLPYLVLDIKEFKTISIVIQYMKGSYGRVDMGAIMACLIMAIIPVVVFYLCAQKYIVKGVAAGAVKG